MVFIFLRGLFDRDFTWLGRYPLDVTWVGLRR